MSRKQVIWDIYTFEGIVPGENTYFVTVDLAGQVLSSSEIASLAYDIHQIPDEFRTKEEALAFVKEFVTSGIIWDDEFNVRPKYTQHTSEEDDPDDGLDPLMTDFRNEDGDSDV